MQPQELRHPRRYELPLRARQVCPRYFHNVSVHVQNLNQRARVNRQIVLKSEAPKIQ